MTRPGLIVLGGLPGTGKSTVAVPLARRLGAAYLRIDRIEQALADSGELPRRPTASGYLVGYGLARDQLTVGVTVVAECVNPLRITRDAWKDTGDRHGEWTLEVELVCSLPDEHRARVENRTVDVEGLVPPTWQQVLDRDYEPWDRDHLVIDTATSSIASTVETIARHANALSTGQSRDSGRNPTSR
ncbi:AAA family ATPase [Amycolatopsis jiangsuensis]|uniref:Putative kinase n=1 Tax=Amycolatopsis jiangsuensis TaxID=1181879 RepID=A0A840IYM4_9PSEU|nr:AAA family ATPase [Amycolatopsis jiangsuensis]MBB4686302.1 putative kinase [Amycolatopsis jiangsuensis]